VNELAAAHVLVDTLDRDAWIEEVAVVTAEEQVA
jgi:hypothetical protein